MSAFDRADACLAACARPSRRRWRVGPMSAPEARKQASSRDCRGLLLVSHRSYVVGTRAGGHWRIRPASKETSFEVSASVVAPHPSGGDHPKGVADFCEQKCGPYPRDQRVSAQEDGASRFPHGMPEPTGRVLPVAEAYKSFPGGHASGSENHVLYRTKEDFA